MFESQATVATEAPDALFQQLVSHLGAQVGDDPRRATATPAAGTIELDGSFPNVVKLNAAAQSREALLELEAAAGAGLGEEHVLAWAPRTRQDPAA